MSEKQIFAALGRIMKAIKTIEKDRDNKQQGFKFRGIDDVYNHLHPLMAAEGIITGIKILSSSREERATKSGSVLAFVTINAEYTLYAPDGSSFTTNIIAEAMDSGDKATSKAMSIAHKNLLLQMFLIPTAEQKDSEADNYEVVESRFLNADEIANIEALLTEVGGSRSGFLRWAKAQDLSGIKAEMYDECIEIIERKRKK